MQQREHSTLYTTRSILSSKWNSNKTNSQCSLPISSWLIGEDLAKTQDERLDWTGMILTWTEPQLDHVETDRPGRTNTRT